MGVFFSLKNGKSMTPTRCNDSRQAVTDTRTPNVSIETEGTHPSLTQNEFAQKNRNDLLVHLGMITIEPSKTGFSVVGPTGNKCEVSTLFDSAGLGTVRPVMEGFSKCCELLPSKQKNRIISRLEKQNDNYLVPFWNGEDLGIVVRELLVNAQRAIESKKNEGRVSIVLSIQDDCIVITISDNGPGFPQSVPPEKLFDKGFTTKRVPNHSKDLVGNGLYRSKEFVERICNGDLLLTNRCSQNGEVIGASAEIRISII